MAEPNSQATTIQTAQKPQVNNNDSNREVNLNDIVNMILGHWQWYLASSLIFLFIGLAYLYRTPSVYSRTAKVIVDESSQNKTLMSLTQAAGIDRGLGGNTTVMNEQEAFQSPDLMEMVVERNNLNTSYVEKKNFRSRELYLTNPISLVLEGDNPLNGFSFVATPSKEGGFVLSEFTYKKEHYKDKIKGNLGEVVETPLGKFIILANSNIEEFTHPITIRWNNSYAKGLSLCKNLSVQAGKISTVLNLSYTDGFPARAELILSSLIDVYNEVWINNKNLSSRNTSQFIESRLGGIERELGAIEDDIQAYKSNNKITDVKSLGQVYLSESTTYNAAVFDLNNQIEVAKFIRDYLTDPRNSSSLIPANLGLKDSGVNTQISSYNEIVLKRTRLISNGSQNNPLVAEYQQNLDQLRSAIISSIDNLNNSLKIQYNLAKKQEDSILKEIARSSGMEFQLLSMERQQKVKESLYTFLLERREENELQSLVNVGNLRIIVKPSGSPAPISPGKMKILAVVLLLGLALPFAVFYMLFMIDTTVKTRAELASLKVPFLGEIPLYSEKKHKQKWYQFWRNFKKEDLYDDKNTKIVIKAGKRNGINEAYRVLRTNLDMMLESKKAHVIMLSSFNPNAGKTFTIVNMAASMAIKGAKTILVDLDMRKGTCGKTLNINTKNGVSNYLAGKCDDLNSLIINVQKDLDCIPVGTLPPNPTELLLTDRFEKLIAELKNKYDYVFIDCPPINIVADASIITKVCDMTIFIIRSGLFDIRMIPSFNALYEEGKYSQPAVILNAIRTDQNSYGYGKYGYGYGKYGYGYGHGYGYGYGYGEQDD